SCGLTPSRLKQLCKAGAALLRGVPPLNSNTWHLTRPAASAAERPAGPPPIMAISYLVFFISCLIYFGTVLLYSKSMNENIFFEACDSSRENLSAIVSSTLGGLDDGELFVEISQSESLVFDDGKLKNAS